MLKRSLGMLASACFATVCLGQDAPDLGPEFVVEQVSPLDSTIVIGAVRDADVSNETLLIADQIGQGAHLFDLDGTHRRSLSISDCIPGRGFLPLSGRLGADRIVVVSSGSAFLRFSREGDCEGEIDRQLRPAPKWDMSADHRLFILNDSNSEVRIVSAEGRLEETWSVRQPTHPELERRWEGGGIRWYSGAVYAVGVVADVVAVVSSDGSVSSVPIRSSLLRVPTEADLPGSSGAEMFAALRRLGASSSIINNLFVLNEELLLLTFLHDRTRGFVLLGLDGREVGRYVGPHQVIHAEENQLYVVFQPEIDEDGEIPNPVVVRYRYND